MANMSVRQLTTPVLFVGDRLSLHIAFISMSTQKLNTNEDLQLDQIARQAERRESRAVVGSKYYSHISLSLH